MTTNAVSMVMTNPGHMGPINSPFAGSGANILDLERTMGAGDPTRAGTFRQAMLQALDGVSGAQQNASSLARAAIVNPGLVDTHDVSIAQAQANMSLGITMNILNRLVQGWKDVINTR
jgi:flagellar hook-basal body complex protein FliE